MSSLAEGGSNMGRDKESKPQLENVLNNQKYRKQQEVGAAYQGSIETGAHIERMTRFQARQGHGYAAEQANHLLDRMQGKSSQILGDDNAKNGLDRMVDGQWVQSKYCQTAAESVNAAFQNGTYRYLDGNGHAMQLEVPKDQYKDAVELMKTRIENGQVPGVTDKNMAEKLVWQGNIDYKTARRIAKAGNIDSLMFDAAHATVVATTAMGISGAITFAREIWNGKDVREAVDLAAYQGLQMGGAVFASSVLAAQLTRTGVNRLMMAPSIKLVKLLPSSVRKAMVQSLRKGPMIYGNAATKNLAKLMRSNIISAGAMILVLSAGDITNFFRGRMSAKQLLKNVTTLAAGMGGGAVAGATAGAVLGPAGVVIGGIVGGTLAGEAAHAVLDRLIEDDVKEMLRILNDTLVPLAQEYLLSEDELAIVVDDLQRELVQDKLLEMYASKNRAAFAEELLRAIIERTVGFRAHVHLPSSEDFIRGMGHILELSQTDGALAAYLQGLQVDAQKVGKQLLGREVPANAARKAWYVTKQRNTVAVQQEQDLYRMKQTEKTAREQRAQDEASLADARKEFTDLLGE